MSADIPSYRNSLDPLGRQITAGFRGIALEVEDMTTAVDYLQSKGIAIVLGLVDLRDSFCGEIRDPDGLIRELRQWKQ